MARSEANKEWRKARIYHFAKIYKDGSDSKHFWKSVKSIYGTTKDNYIAKLVTDTGHAIEDDMTKATLLNNAFAAISTKDVDSIDVADWSPVNKFGCNLSGCDFDCSTVYSVLNSLDETKATGPDGIGNKILRACSYSLCEPLTYIFKRSLNVGEFPTLWKSSNIVPIFKQGDASLISNYRPVSLLCCVSKVFEKIVYERLYNYCISNDILSSNNSGFKRGDGTVNRLLYITETIEKALDTGMNVAMVFLDISKAFDKILFEGLLFKL